MRDVRYFCPQCQSIELEISKGLIIHAAEQGPTASCATCAWEGPLKECLGAIAPEGAQFWDANKVANLLLLVVSKYAAGPLIQVMEHVGLLPRERNSDAEELRDELLRTIIGAAVSAAFEKAAELAPAYYAKHDPQQGKATERIFSFAKEEHSDGQG